MRGVSVRSRDDPHPARRPDAGCDIGFDVDGNPIPTSRTLSSDAWGLASRRAWHGFIRHRGLDSAAALSFYAALTIFPASLAVVSSFALLDDRARAARDILAVIRGVASPSAATTLSGPIHQLLNIPNPGVALSIGLVLTLWTLSGYVTAFGRAVNTAYEVMEGREFILLRGLMIGVAAVLMVAIGLIIAILLGTPDVASTIAKTFALPEWAVILWDVLKWPVLAGLASLIVAILYYFSPNVRHLRIRWVTWGALLAILVWVLATAGFAAYVLNVSHYNRVYGWLGGAVVLLLWLYISNLVVVFGAEVDAEIVRVRQLEAGIVAEETIGLPLRSTYRNLILARRLSADVARGRALRLRADERRAATAHEESPRERESQAKDARG